METQIPFSGFYNSIHDAHLDHALETYLDSNKNLIDKVSYDMEWQPIFLEYAKEYAHQFAQEYSIDCKFKLLCSPKEYNFEMDRIICEIPETEVFRLYAETPKELFSKQAVKMFTSCSGFISHYSNDIERWGEFTEYDHNQVYCLMLAYLGQETDLNDINYKIMELMDDKAYQLIGDYIPRRYLKIVNYLYERSQRSI